VLRIKHLLVAIQNWITIKITIFGFNSKPNKVELVRLGSEYGGWWLPSAAMSNSHLDRVAISAGLGFDVSFDKSLLELGFTVIGLDPLADCVAHANSNLAEFRSFTSLEKGLWKTTGVQNFFSPKNVEHDSWSATNIQHSSESMTKTFEVVSLTDLFIRYPQLEKCDYRILKMDIEGSELEVMKSLTTFQYRFDFIAIEIDFLSLIPFMKFRHRIMMIKEARSLLGSFRSAGYQLVKTENFNFFWIPTESNFYIPKNP
jgi:FkbM family methyltransferase